MLACRLHDVSPNDMIFSLQYVVSHSTQLVHYRMVTFHTYRLWQIRRGCSTLAVSCHAATTKTSAKHLYSYLLSISLAPIADFHWSMWKF